MFNGYKLKKTPKTSETVGLFVTQADSHKNSYHLKLNGMNSTRPMGLAPVHSSDHLITRAILSHNLTTIAFSVQELHIDARYTRFNTFASYYSRSKSNEHSRILFHMWLLYTGTIFIDLLPSFSPSLSTQKRSGQIPMS